MFNSTSTSRTYVGIGTDYIANGETGKIVLNAQKENMSLPPV